MTERWTFEGGQWIVSDRGERIAQIYNWHAGYLERGERLANLPQVESQNAFLLEALRSIEVRATNALQSDGKVFLGEVEVLNIAQDAIRKVVGEG